MSLNTLKSYNNYYAIPDIHGRNDLLQLALKDLYTKNPNGGKIIFLGDYIDRGKDNKGVLHTVMNPPENWEFIPIKGNHEDMFIDAYDRGGYDFYDVGVLEEFLPKDQFVFRENYIHHFPKEIISWMRNLKKYHIEDKNVCMVY